MPVIPQTGINRLDSVITMQRVYCELGTGMNRLHKLYGYSNCCAMV